MRMFGDEYSYYSLMVLTLGRQASAAARQVDGSVQTGEIFQGVCGLHDALPPENRHLRERFRLVEAHLRMPPRNNQGNANAFG